MNSTIAKISALVILTTTASFANAGNLVNVADTYLYESLIQAEFDIETTVDGSVASSTKFDTVQVLVAKAKENDSSEDTQNVAE